MAHPPRLAIIGGSLAAHRTIQMLRRRGDDRQIVLVGAEHHRPYDRPPLSKELLAGTVDVDDVDLGLDPQGVQLRLGVAATRLVPRERRIELADGSTLTADDVVIATGAAARALPGQPDLAGLHTLRTLDDALAIRAALATAEHLVVVGGGFIGSEVASTARSLGLAVTVLEADTAPVVRGVGPVVGGALARLHRAAGVDLRVDARVAGFVGDRGRVAGVELADGHVIDADLVVVGIGAVPATGWLEGSGLTLDDGVVTDDHCRAVGGDGHIWALGDVARWPSARYGRTLRVEHWTNVTEQAMVVAQNLTGGDHTHDPIPYVWSDQFGHKLQTLGHVRPDDRIEVIAGDLDGEDWVVAYLRAGRLAGIVGLDRPGVVMRARQLIADAADLPTLRATLPPTP